MTIVLVMSGCTRSLAHMEKLPQEAPQGNTCICRSLSYKLKHRTQFQPIPPQNHKPQTFQLLLPRVPMREQELVAKVKGLKSEGATEAGRQGKPCCWSGTEGPLRTAKQSTYASLDS